MGARKRRFGKSETVSFRCPPELQEYLEKAGSGKKGATGAVIRQAITLDLKVDRRLSPRRAEMEAFATERGIDLDDEWAEAVAAAVLELLDLRKKSLTST